MLKDIKDFFWTYQSLFDIPNEEEAKPERGKFRLYGNLYILTNRVDKSIKILNKKINDLTKRVELLEKKASKAIGQKNGE